MPMFVMSLVVMLCSAEPERTEAQKLKIVADFQSLNGREWHVEPVWQGAHQVARASRIAEVGGASPKRPPTQTARAFIDKNRHFFGLKPDQVLPVPQLTPLKDGKTYVTFQFTAAALVSPPPSSPSRTRFSVTVVIVPAGTVGAVESDLSVDDSHRE